MNKQQGPTRIEWTDWTWNPVAGCQHGCSWTMPDGQVANCYAEDIADATPAHYPRGFEAHYYHPSWLTEPLKVTTPSKIFVGSMADVFGHWVPDDQIQAILDTCRQAHWHQFQFLTKNPPRLRKFDFPPNCWVGVSAPPSEMMGKPLTAEQQERWFYVAVQALSRCNAAINWVSFEPLSYDIADSMGLEEWESIIDTLDWAVIGAASRGRQYYQPDPGWLVNLLCELDALAIPVFFKGNLRGNPIADPWREEFPRYTPSSDALEGPKPQQLSLF
ncbi:MAG: DUF5131 family protein [Anaerolineae bacterium]|nr:DUF5131 family protein [Anaerolineae bacterium]